MSKDLKDLIERAEEDQTSRAFLEKTIDNLKAEVISLKRKLEEKRSEFKIEPIRHIEEIDEYKEISMLKNMISSLKKQLIEKERNNNNLHNELTELKIEFEKVRDEMFNSAKDEMIIKTQNSLNTLIQDYGKLESENKTLKKKISKLQEEFEASSNIKTSLQTEKFNKEQLEKEIGNLNSKIYELESNNQTLIRKIKNLESHANSTNLEKMIEILKSNNSELEKENKALNQNLENLKRENFNVQKYEAEIDQLKSKIEQLKDLNQQLKDKDSILLAKTITAMSSGDRKKSKPTSIVKPQSEEILQAKPEVKKVEQIEIRTTNSVKDQPNAEIFDEIKIDNSKKIEKVPDQAEDGSVARKWQCPQCGNTNKAQIREEDDKTRIIYTYPKIYAKKYICGQCGKEWR